jgi:catechol 2,3-dioxygenase-like lactoylglutathione lyase family enzyme
MPAIAETMIPLLPCKALEETLDYYRALGFEVTYQQKDPYLYGAVQRGAIQLHFSTLTTFG